MQDYIKLIALQLGLEGWEFTLDDKPAGEDEYANVSVVYGQRRAIICLAKDRSKWTAETARDTIVHELMHCHLEPISEISSDVLDTAAGARVAAVGNAAVSYVIERTVDAVSTAIAKFMPLPTDEDMKS